MYKLTLSNISALLLRVLFISSSFHAFIKHLDVTDEAEIHLASEASYCYYGRLVKVNPFLVAALVGNLPVLKKLKKKGVDVKFSTEYGDNALLFAIDRGVKYEVVEWLINTAKLDIESVGRLGITPFLLAAKRGNIAVLKLLYEKGANVNPLYTDMNQENALHLAASYVEDTQVIRWLLHTAKIPIEAKNGFRKKTAFLFAAEKGNLPVLKILKEEKANVRATNEYNKNALDYALTYSYEKKEVINWLKKECALKKTSLFLFPGVC